jgi:hypothetical protein
VGQVTKPNKVSEFEGKEVMASGHHFLIKNGRRLWLDPVPRDVLPDLIYDDCTTILRQTQFK